MGIFSILKDVYDDDICYDDIGFNTILFYKWVKSHIEEIRKEIKEERIFINFEDIVERWTSYYHKTKDTHLVHNAKLRRKKTIRGKGI
ncbi:hypothetical protein [Parapedobacter sp. 2B3]|uniref:DUF4760 domain-containing protein n=1 Tax=Parapedobacter sp. 2B3 TaxID=3342381 RepID=UPI0035B63727